MFLKFVVVEGINSSSRFDRIIYKPKTIHSQYEYGFIDNPYRYG